MKRLLSLIAACAMVFTTAAANMSFSASADEVIKIACVGDSITAGTNATNYPMYLQNILGDGYEVKNFGKGGAAVKPSIDTDSDGDGVNDSRFYYDDERYQNSLTYDADYVFVMMGTNDVRGDLDSYFKADYYTYLIKPYLDNGSQVVIMTSPWAYSYILADHMVINTTIRQLQYELAEENNLTLIDMNTATSGMRECFPDGLHGNSSGYTIIAQTIYKEIFDGTLYTLQVNTSPNTFITLNGDNDKYGTYYRYADENGKASIEVMPDTYTLSYRCDNYISQYNAERIDLNSADNSTTKMLESGDYVISTGAYTYTDDDDNGNYPASRAVDEDATSSWQTTVAGWGLPAGTHWLTVDLGLVRNDLTGVRIKGDINPQDYEIQVSDDNKNWTTVYTVKGNSSKEELENKFDGEVSGRYVRLYATNSLMNNFGYRYYQIATFQVLASSIITYTDSENLAVNATVSADSVHSQYSGALETVIDGDYNTRWQAQSKGHDGDDSWLKLTFDEELSFNKAVIYWETARATESGYVLQYSNDDVNWTDASMSYFIREEVKMAGNTEYRDTLQFDEINAKYVRIYVTETNGGKDNPSVWEFEIYMRTADTAVTPPENTEITYENGFATGIVAGMTVNDIEGASAVKDKDGNAVTGDTLLGTGYVITKDGEDYTVVILGDVNGDGEVNSTDFMQIRRSFLGTFGLGGASLIAADVNSDGEINSTDFMRIRRHFLGTFDIYA